jgi:hypothetical protein
MDPILSKKLQSFSPLLVRAFLKLISLSRPSLSTPLPSSPSSSGSSFEQSGSPLGAKDGKVLGEKERDTLGVKEGEELEDTDIMRESRLGKNLATQMGLRRQHRDWRSMCALPVEKLVDKNTILPTPLALSSSNSLSSRRTRWETKTCQSHNLGHRYCQ